jgi:predicted O-methyltransferase YrrM
MMAPPERIRYRPEHPDLIAVFEGVRQEMTDATIVAPYVGDGMFRLIRKNGYRRCLEIGMATGSTACYMLKAVGPTGEVISIDRAQTTHYNSVGLRTVERAGLPARHMLIESDSVTALIEMWKGRESFDFVFMDGWKTFDHMAAELYFIVRILRTGGTIVFDDAHMKSVSRAVRMAEGHYQMKKVWVVPPAAKKELAGHALFYLATFPFRPVQALRVLTGHVAALRKDCELSELPVTQDWNFYADF